MAMAEWNNGKEFSIRVSHRTQIDRLIHMTDVGFDEFTLTLIQSGLMIEELNHTDSCTERFAFSSDGLPPYTARCHWWILGAIRMILMIDHSNCLNQKSSGPSEEFRWCRWWDHDMSHYHTELNLTGSHKQGLGSGRHQSSLPSSIDLD